MANRPERIGKYEITDVIGGGGMGKVYKARDPRMRRTVAIKVIKGDFSEEPEFLRRFEIEAQALAGLVHPNIVVVHDLGDEHGSPYLVMEYLDGVALDKIIAERRSVTIVQKLGIVIEVLNALQYAHQHNIVHRDVKPGNVMVLNNGSVKLLDFGIAREGDMGHTRTGQTMGTEWYMSPEGMNGEVVDGRSDVYSAGILLYEFLAYTLPFDPRDRRAMILKRLRGDPAPPLSTYLDAYPPELDEIIARALAFRDQRYGTAEEFAFDLGRVQFRLKRDDASNRISRARELIQLRDLPAACELLSEAIRLDTENQTAKQLLFELRQALKTEERRNQVKRLFTQASSAFDAKQLDTAEKFAEEALRLAPTETDLLHLREQIELAKTRAQQLQKLLTLANVAKQTGELDMAKKAVDEALALDPQDTDARLLGSAIARLAVERESQRQVQQFLQSARREIEGRQYTAAVENIARAKAIDATYPEIAGLERMLNASQQQEVRERELTELRSQIEQELRAGRARAARDIAIAATRKYSGEQDFVRLKSLAEAAAEKEERRLYIDERIAVASRIVDGGDAERALRMLQDVDREHPADSRLREYLEFVRQAAGREAVAKDKQKVLQHARNAMRQKAFTETIRLLENGLVQYPEDGEIKDLLKAARDEFELLSKKKQVEDVSKQVQDLLQSRAHTDAIRLLERTSAQFADPELIKLLQYARREAENFRAAALDAGQRATQMMNLKKPAEAVTFLEAQAEKYGKNPDFQVLLEQARIQAKDAERAKERLSVHLRDAREKLRAQDITGAEALLRVCEGEHANDPDVFALAVEIEEEKKAAVRRANETERLSDEQNAGKGREQRTGLEQKVGAAATAAPESGSSWPSGGATGSDSDNVRGLATASVPSDALAAGRMAARAVEEPSLSATQVVGAHSGPAVESAVLTPPPIEVVPPAAPISPKKAEPEKKFGSEPLEPQPASIETVIAPLPAKRRESASLGMQNVVEEPEPAAPPRAPGLQKPSGSDPVAPPEGQPPKSKGPTLVAYATLAALLLAVVVWFIVHRPWPAKAPETPRSAATTPAVPVVPEPPKPTTALVRIIGMPTGAKFTLGDVSREANADGTAEVETKPGLYTLEADAPEYEHYSRKGIQLELGENEPLTITMKPLHSEQLGTLIVKGNVEHFEVLIDGKVKSNSGSGQQVKIENLPEGLHKVVIKKSGYEDLPSKDVRITAKKEQTVSFTLTLADAPLLVTVHPAGRIRIDDGSPIDVTPSYSGKLSPGSHKVEASAEGYQTQTRAVMAKAGEPVPLSFELIPKPQPPPPPAPSATLSADSKSLEEGQSTILRWTTQNATDLKISGVGSVQPANGNQSVWPPLGTTTYVLTAKGNGGSAESSVTIVIKPKAQPPTAEPPLSKPSSSGAANSSDDEQAIRSALVRLQKAFESIDPENEIKIAWPSINPNLLKRIVENIDKVQHYSVDETCPGQPRITGSSATWSCTQTEKFRVGSNIRPQQPHTVLFGFRKDQGKWVVDSREVR